MRGWPVWEEALHSTGAFAREGEEGGFYPVSGILDDIEREEVRDEVVVGI